MTNEQILKLKIAHNALTSFKASKIKYWVEDVQISGENYIVTYIDNSLLLQGIPDESQWLEKEISREKLVNYILDNDLNFYELNSSDNYGQHVQVHGAIPIELYLVESLNEAVKAYLEDKRNG